MLIDKHASHAIVTARATILVPLVGAAEDQRCLKAAEALAGRLHGHIEALHVVADPAQQLALLTMDDLPIPQDVIDEQQAGIVERARTVAAEFATWRNEAGHIGKWTQDETGRTAELQTAEGEWRDVLGRHALTADFVLVALPGRNHPQRFDALSTALFSAGRPVLVLPMLAPVPSFARDQVAAIAWNKRPQAARAVTAALPLLRDCSETVVLVAGDEDPADADRLFAYLRRQGVNPVLRCIRDEGDTGAVLHRHAHDCGARFLVMGGYSRSMTREMIFGGVTEFMLKNATLPLLMAH